MADKPVTEIVNLDAVLDALPDSPTTSDVYEATLPFSARDVAASAAQRAINGGGGGGGSSAWDEHVLGVTSGDWTDDGNGTWTFVAGVIAQTDLTGDSTIQADTPYPSIDYVVQTDVRIKSGQDAGTTAQAVISAGNRDMAIASVSGALSAALGEGATIIGDTTGDAATFHAAPMIDAAVGNFDTPVAAAVTLDAWHTLRAVVAPNRQVVYIDGAYLCSLEKRTGGNDGSNTDLVMIGAVGLVDFRNVKVWTRALPA